MLDAANADSARVDLRALTHLFQKHRPELRAMVDRRLDRRIKRRVDASDVVQDGFMEATTRFPQYVEAPSMPLLEWLSFIIRQRVLACFRHHAGAGKRDVRRLQALPTTTNDSRPPGMEQFATSNSTPSQAAIRDEEDSHLHGMLSELSREDQLIIKMRHFEDMSNLEVAARLGIEPAAASKRYCRAIARFRKRLGEAEQ